MIFNQTNHNAGNVTTVRCEPTATHNINEEVRVVLTERGRMLWEKHWRDLDLEPWGMKEDGSITVPLWNLMSTFGPHIYMGMFETPFVGNVIEFV